MAAKKNILRLLKRGNTSIQNIGIVSTENDYRICWSLNEALGITLTRIVASVPDAVSSEPFVEFSATKEELTYRFITLRNTSGIRSSRLPKVDYILRIEGITDPATFHEILRNVKRAPFITLAYEIPEDKNLATCFISIFPSTDDA